MRCSGAPPTSRRRLIWWSSSRPHLVAPSVPGQRLASPLDNYIPTNDVDFFLMGEMEQKKKFRDYITSGGDIQGPYGHMIRSGPALPAISAPPISAKN